MESTIDLILKGHFETLKERANRQYAGSSTLSLTDTLTEMADYLSKDDSKKALRLRAKVMDLLQAIEGQMPMKMEKKPMKKAGGKQSKKQDRKAM